MKGYIYFLGLFLIYGMISCETTINPELQNAPPVLVVDAWINSKPDTQTIHLTLSQPYFEATTPPAASGALVTVSDDHGRIYSFIENSKIAGAYQWIPSPNDSIGPVGSNYVLTIQYNGETYTAKSHMGRTAQVDSITFKKEDRLGRATTDTYRGQFWGTDPKGAGDMYWIRTYKNGVLLDKPAEINVAYDAGFSPGSDFDGVTFITPKRQGINPEDKDANGKSLSPYLPGDSVYVEIHSITRASFDFLGQVEVQTNRPGGFAELFARPLANVSTNVTNNNPNGSKVVGFFNVAAVKGRGKKFTL